MFSSPQEFWEQNSEYQDRKFYVAFCMLESTLSNYAVARDLHVHNKLDWACTTYYYSLVHALRLICFMAKGDFPRRHDKLAELFKGETSRGKWLTNFLRQCQNSGVNVNETDFSLQDIISALSSGTASETERKFRRWGEILDKARDLRNDSNYEGLIIAHEHAHIRVTEDFRNLALVLKKAAEEILPEVIIIFRNFIDQHGRRDYWYAFLNYQERLEGVYYLKDVLKYKLLGRAGIIWSPQESEIQHSTAIFDISNGEQIIRDISEWLQPLRLNAIENVLAEEVRENIQFGIFNEKRSLMKSFREDIAELGRIIEGNIHG